MRQQSVNCTLTLRFIPHRSWLALGPGWAALAGVLASGGFHFEAEVLLKAGLLWLLADPILGTIWHLVAEQGIWRRLGQAPPSGASPLKLRLPYVVKDSAGYKLSIFWTNLRTSENGQGYTLLITLFLALLISAILGGLIVSFVIVSVLLAFVIGLTGYGEGQQFWQSLATFLLPYLAGLIVMGQLPLQAVALGYVYWVIYLSTLRLRAGKSRGAWLVIIGQGVAAGLFFSLTLPLAATVLTLAVMFSLLLWVQAKMQSTQPEIWYAEHVKPYLLVGLFAAAVSLGVG